METLIVRNIKISLLLEPTNFIQKNIQIFAFNKNVTKKKHSFFVVRNEFVYTIFYSGYINITGLKCNEDIKTSIMNILKLLKISSENIYKIKIDNIVASNLFNEKIEIRKYILFLREKKYKIRYNPHRFPGATLKLIKGSILFFVSGKFILLGFKNITDLHCENKKFISLFEEYKTSNDVLYNTMFPSIEK